MNLPFNCSFSEHLTQLYRRGLQVYVLLCSGPPEIMRCRVGTHLGARGRRSPVEAAAEGGPGASLLAATGAFRRLFR